MCGGNDLGLFLSVIIGIDEFIQCRLDTFDLFLKESNSLPNHLLKCFINGGGKSVFLLCQEFIDLSSSGDEIPHFLWVFIEGMCRSRVHHVCELSDNPCVDPVGFRKLIPGTRKTLDLIRVDDRDFEVILMEEIQQTSFVTSCSFYADEVWFDFLQE